MAVLTGTCRIPYGPDIRMSVLARISIQSHGIIKVMQKTVTIQLSWFYAQIDEDHFFQWLESIPAVEKAVGGPNGLTIVFKDVGLERKDWVNLLGLFTRYGIDMRVLRELVTPEHEGWLKDPEEYWYSGLWGNP
jgi:hypothetical protein